MKTARFTGPTASVTAFLLEQKQECISCMDTPTEGFVIRTQGGETMRPVTVLSNRVRSDDIADAAKKCLRNSPYKGILAGVSCNCHQGMLFLSGHLSRFHHKQVAQEAVARVNGVTQVVNEIEVD